MILHTLENKSHPNKNNTSLGWQKGSNSGVGLKFSAQSQYIAGLNPWFRLICYSDI